MPYIEIRTVLLGEQRLDCLCVVKDCVVCGQGLCGVWSRTVWCVMCGVV